jgi:SAM-dependent methyltransferase
MRTNYRFLYLFIKAAVQKKIVHKNTINILEPGCGEGEFLEDLRTSLKADFPEVEFNVYGFDVTLLPKLTSIDPEKVNLIAENDVWPYRDDFFDIIVSNQVLEHVKVPQIFFGELSRVMNNGANALHLFPTKEIIIEPHCFLPMTHWIDNWDFRKKMIKTFSWIGLGRYRRRNIDGHTLEKWSTIVSDMATHFIHYLKLEEYFRMSERLGLRASARFTHELYLYLFLSKLKRSDHFSLDFDREYSMLYDLLFFSVYKRLKGIALYQEKTNVA